MPLARNFGSAELDIEAEAILGKVFSYTCAILVLLLNLIGS